MTREINILGLDGKDKRVRLCAVCGHSVGLGKLVCCPDCAGPLVTVGPIEWTEEDERKAMEDLDVEDTKEDFQDMVCFLWDMIEEGEEQIIDCVAGIEELKGEIETLKGVVDEKNAEITELKTKLEDESLKGKVKKAFGTE